MKRYRSARPPVTVHCLRCRRPLLFERAYKVRNGDRVELYCDEHIVVSTDGVAWTWRVLTPEEERAASHQVARVEKEAPDDARRDVPRRLPVGGVAGAGRDRARGAGVDPQIDPLSGDGGF